MELKEPLYRTSENYSSMVLSFIKKNETKCSLLVLTLVWLSPPTFINLIRNKIVNELTIWTKNFDFKLPFFKKISKN